MTGRDRWPTDTHREDQNNWLLGRLWERSEQQMDFLRDIKQRLEDGTGDFRALAVVDATLGQKIQRNTEDIADIRRTLAMRPNSTDDNRPKGVLGQLIELLRTVKEIAEAVAAPWKITVGAILAVLMAKGIVEPELPFKIIKAVLSAGSE